MLSPIPRRILRDTMTLYVPTSFDRYQAPVYDPQAVTTYTVKNVHVQADNASRKSASNTEVQLVGTIFVDARYSTPALDYEALQEAVQAAGGLMTCTITNRHGNASGPYTIAFVDGLPDDDDNLHHWELGVY